MILPWRIQLWRRDRALARGRSTRLASWQGIGGGEETGTLVAFGDCSLQGSTAARATEGGRAGLFGDLLPTLDGADLVTGNLESMLTGRTERNGEAGSFLRAPPEAAPVLAGDNATVLTCANNHCLDHGAPGLLESLERLAELDIRAVGAGASRARADASVVVEAAGLRIGFLARCDDFRMQPEALAGATPAPLDREALLPAIAALREEVDLVAVHLHLGYEFELHPLLHHRDLARACADAGAGLVLVHHAHVPMGLEIRGAALIAHGLGNFCGPVGEYMRAGHPWTDRSFLLEIGVGRDGPTRYRLHPLRVDRDGCPRSLTGRQAEELLGGIERMSRRLGDDRFLDRMTRARLVREARSQLLTLDAAYRGKTAAAEIAGNLEDPRQRELRTRLRAIAPRAADLLDSAAGRSLPPWTEADLSACLRELDLLDPPGRLPPGAAP